MSETKLDSTFLTGQFLINGYSKLFRIDRSNKRAGIMLYFREDISLLGVEVSPTEIFYVKINFRKKKWLLFCSYNPKKTTFNLTWKT